MPNEEYQNKPQQYVVMEQEILCRKDLSLMAKFVYARMSGFKEFWESPEKTGEFFGKSAKTILSARQELEKKGLIKCVRNTGRGKAYRVVRMAEIGQSDYQELGSQTTQNLVAYNKEYIKEDNYYNVRSDFSEEDVEKSKKMEKAFNKAVDKALELEEAMQLARYLRAKIVEKFPNNRSGDTEAKLKRWAVDIDKMIRIDKRTPEAVKNAIDFAMNDNFWCNNIWSGEKLRKHYDSLEAKARQKILKNGVIYV